MKDKEMIEEMAKDICGMYNEGRCEINGHVCILRCDSRIRAEICYEQGYRKIPENSVILSREEYNDLKGLEKKFDDYLIKEIVATRKEIAEKILIKGKQLVKKWLSRDDEKVGFIFDFEEFIKKQYGVEIKE